MKWNCAKLQTRFALLWLLCGQTEWQRLPLISGRGVGGTARWGTTDAHTWLSLSAAATATATMPRSGRSLSPRSCFGTTAKFGQATAFAAATNHFQVPKNNNNNKTFWQHGALDTHAMLCPNQIKNIRIPMPYKYLLYIHTFFRDG